MPPNPAARRVPAAPAGHVPMASHQVYGDGQAEDDEEPAGAEGCPREEFPPKQKRGKDELGQGQQPAQGTNDRLGNQLVSADYQHKGSMVGKLSNASDREHTGK